MNIYFEKIVQNTISYDKTVNRRVGMDNLILELLLTNKS